jgi:hypothetical protein
LKVCIFVLSNPPLEALFHDKENLVILMLETEDYIALIGQHVTYLDAAIEYFDVLFGK